MERSNNFTYHLREMLGKDIKGLLESFPRTVSLPSCILNEKDFSRGTKFSMMAKVIF
jgi:hypothetical protein